MRPTCNSQSYFCYWRKFFLDFTTDAVKMDFTFQLWESASLAIQFRAWLSQVANNVLGVSDPIFRISIASILVFSAGSGYRSDETNQNSIFCIATIVLLLSPTKATNT